MQMTYFTFPSIMTNFLEEVVHAFVHLPKVLFMTWFTFSLVNFMTTLNFSMLIFMALFTFSLRIVMACLHCYKPWGAIPPAWSDDTILNLQADRIYFRQVWFVNALSLPNLSDDIGYFRYWYTPPPAPWTDFCNKMQLYFVHVYRMPTQYTLVIWTWISCSVCRTSTPTLLVINIFQCW